MLVALFSFLPGIGAMDNIHPLFVHYPIALFTAFFVAEFFGVVLKNEDFRCAASFCLYLGTIAAVFTVAAGYYAAATVEHSEKVHAIMENHEGFGVTVLIIAAVLSAWRLYVRRKFSPKLQLAHLALAFILAVVIALGADLGGLMVYKYGVGGQAVKIERALHLKAGDSHDADASADEHGETGHHHHHHHHSGE
jgi:uncharacterized membrane protein